MDKNITPETVKRMLGDVREAQALSDATYYDAVLYTEGTLSADERAKFELRLGAEPALAKVVSEMAELYRIPYELPTDEDLALKFRRMKASIVGASSSSPQVLSEVKERQSQLVTLKENLRAFYQRIVQRQADDLRARGIFPGLPAVTLFLNWHGAVPALNRPRSGCNNQQAGVEGASHLPFSSSVFQLLVPELEALGWSSLVERQTEITALGVCQLTYSFARKTKQSAGLSFALLLSDGTLLEQQQVQAGILSFEVPCECVSPIPDEVLLLTGELGAQETTHD